MKATRICCNKISRSFKRNCKILQVFDFSLNFFSFVLFEKIKYLK